MLYRDVWDQKPPGIHLTYAAGFALFGTSDRTVLLLDIIAATVACAGVFAIARRLCTARVAWASAIAFAIGTYPAFALPYGGFLERAVPETFITALAATAAWCAVTSRVALAGLAIGVAVVYKPTALIYWPLFAFVGSWFVSRGPGSGVRGPWSVVRNPWSGVRGPGSVVRNPWSGIRGPWSVVRNPWSVVRGAGSVGRNPWAVVRGAVLQSGAALLIPVAGVIAWLWANGALGDARIAVIDYNRAYVVAGSSWLALPNILVHELWRLVKTDSLWCAAAVGGAAAVWTAAAPKTEHGRRKTEEDGREKTEVRVLPVLAIAWLAAVVIAAAANGVRMYATYFLPAAPPLALLAGSLLDDKPGGRARPLVSAAAVVFAGIVAVHSHYPDRLIRYTAADFAQLRGTAPRAAHSDGSAQQAAYLDGSARRAAYLEMFGGYANGRGYSARANAELAAYLRDHTTDTDRVYIFGMAPAVYFDAKRLPANRFVWTFPAAAPFAGHPAFTIDALAADLARAAPACLVLERNNRDSSTGWRIEDTYASPSVRGLLAGYVKETDIEDFSVLARSASHR